MYDMVCHRVYEVYEQSRLYKVFRGTQRNFISHYLVFTPKSHVHSFATSYSVIFTYGQVLISFNQTLTFNPGAESETACRLKQI